VGATSLVSASVLPNNLPLTVSADYELHIIVWVINVIAGATIADFEIRYISLRTVDQLVPIAYASLEFRAHTRQKQSLPRVGDQGRFPLQDIDQLVLT